MKVPAFPVYLFDVDGVLIDSAADICGSIRTVLANAAFPECSDEFLRRYIGRHLMDLFRDLRPAVTTDQIDAMVAEYRATYHGRGHVGTSVYPGVAEALGRLSGRKSTATTKGTPATRSILGQFGLLDFFDHVQGTDGFPAKPAPDVVLRSVDTFGVRPEDCLFVGDSAADMDAGRRAGVRICAVRYGYGRHEELERFAPDYWIDDLRDLVS